MTCAMKRRLFVLSLSVCLGQAQVYASTPTEQIQETLQQVLTIMTRSANGNEAERKELLRNALMPRFDFLEMAKRSLGKHWESVPGRQDEFVAAFAEFLGTSYIGKIGSYKDEKILFVREWTEKELAQVDTKVVPSKGDPVAVNYRLHRVQSEWKIYDVVVEDISIVGNYRSQFERILTKGTFDDLLKRLSEKDSKIRN